MENKVIYITGLGSIGGSFASGIRRDYPDYKILGYDRSDKSRNVTFERGIVDGATADFKEFAPLTDVIILTVPIEQTIEFVKALADMDLKDNVTIAGAGSTKREIVEAGEKYLTGKNVRSIGSHPMADSHKSGVIAAEVDLLENTCYIFTLSRLTDTSTIADMKVILSGLHTRYIEIDAAEHDRVTSQVSHSPHILVASLMEQAEDYASEHEMTSHFAAGGFRDMTHIAESEPGMWAGTLLTNKTAVLERISDFKNRLDGVAELIPQSDTDAIWNYFNHVKETRREMNTHKCDGVGNNFDIFVDVPDEGGVILEILELLRGTSLVNVHINGENCGDINSILQTSFKNIKDLEHAKKVIDESTDYGVYVN